MPCPKHNVCLFYASNLPKFERFYANQSLKLETKQSQIFFNKIETKLLYLQNVSMPMTPNWWAREAP